MGRKSNFTNGRINIKDYDIPLISIITPTYNSERYIEKTIESVLSQTFHDFEMVIVDDYSSDNTCRIIERYVQKDNRIRLIKLKKNSGAAVARNTALKYSKGRFIAYLDADDLWMKDKLEKQVSFMLAMDISFSCTSYEVIDNAGNPFNKQIHMLISVDYNSFLQNNLLQTVGIMVDTNKVDKSELKMPLIRRRQDAATWLHILKEGHICYGIDLILAQYRRTKKSLSSNKVSAIKSTWYLYRKVEKLSLPYSCYCFVRYAIMAIWKRIYKI